MKKNFLIFIFLLLTSCFEQNSQINQNQSSLDQSLGINFSDIWVGEHDSGFRNLQVVQAKKYMVSAGHELASKAGAEILAKGGNAVDAAIATELVLNVVEPHSSGIGGGGFLIFYDKKTGQTIYFNGRETAPLNAKADMFLDKNGKPRQFFDVVRGGLSVGVPGLLKMMQQAHDEYGKLPWADLFQPAIKIAREGFLVSKRYHTLSVQISYLKDFKETSEIYLSKDNKAYKTGDKITNLKLADTLEKISREGIAPFYSGKIAHDIVNAVQNSKINPGYLSLADMKNYHIDKGELLCATYRKKYKICTMPPPSSGVTLLQILGILENFDLAKLKPNSPEAVHLIVEATRLSYADRNQFLADSFDFSIQVRLDKEYLKSRAALIQMNKALQKIVPGDFFKYKKFYLKKYPEKPIANDNNEVFNDKAAELPSTTHISVFDAAGNAVAMTNTIEYFFGSAVSVDGFLLNNQLTDFSFEPVIKGKKVSNRLEPGKHPRSSMSPTFVFDKNNNLIMIVGSPGGPRIIQFVAKAIINHFDFGLDIQQSISLPSFVVINDVIELEENRNITELEPLLKKMGHQTKKIEIVSGIQAITINSGNSGKSGKNKTGNIIIEGGADPRREGVAIGK